MSDVPLQSASDGGAQGLSLKVDPRDVADIDRELEAYLREKQLGSTIDLDHSIDKQLSRIKEKVASRPSKKEVVAEVPEPEVAQATTPPVEGEEVAKSPSHEDLIRSLEAKYSAGQKEGPQNKKEAVVKDEGAVNNTFTAPKEAVQKAEVVETPTQQIEEKTLEVPSRVSLLADLVESIEATDEKTVEELIGLAEGLTEDEQENMVQVFLPRFRRNKERKELFERTQVELENELRSFINNRIKRGQSRNPSTPDSEPSKEQGAPAADPEVTMPPVVEEVAVDNAPKVVPTPPEPFDVLEAQKNTTAHTHKVEEVEPVGSGVAFAQVQEEHSAEEVQTQSQDSLASNSVPAVEGALGAESEIIERYKSYLTGLEKKPTVLLYDPNQGFVRKAIDPNDSSLNLSYSFNEVDQTVLLQVFDANGAVLSEIKTPVGEF